MKILRMTAFIIIFAMLCGLCVFADSAATGANVSPTPGIQTADSAQPGTPAATGESGNSTWYIRPTDNGHIASPTGTGASVSPTPATQPGNSAQPGAPMATGANVSPTPVVQPSANAQVSPTPGDKSKYRKSFELLSAMGIIGDTDFDAFSPDDETSRLEFATVAEIMAGLSDVQNMGTDAGKYSDVGASDAAVVEEAVNSGILSDEGNGKFGPGDAVTYEQAVKAMVTILGYGVYAQKMGGYPAGYIAEARNIGVLNDFAAESNQPLDRGGMMLLAYNTLTANLLSQSSYGSKMVYEVESGKNLLTERLKAEHLTGIMSANQDTSLSNTTGTNSNEVIIGGVTYNAGGTNAAEFLGCNVDFYVKQDAAEVYNTIVCIDFEENENNITAINATDVVSVQDEGISYYDSGHINILSKAVSKNANVIYNGVYYGVKRLVPNDILMPAVGSLKFVDSTGDGIADTIFVTKYDTYVVDRTDSTTNYVYYKQANPNAVWSEYLNLDMVDTIQTVRIFDSGDLETEIRISDIREWNILSVAQSLNTSGYVLTTVIRSSNWTSGSVDRISDNIATINGVNYNVSTEYLPLNGHYITADDKGTFYFDFLGEIAGADLEGNKGHNYAYLVNAAPVNSISTQAQFQLFTAKGEMKIYNGADTILYNNIAENPAQVVVSLKVNGVVQSQLVKYELDSDGKLSKLATAVNNTKTPNYPGYDLNDFSLDFTEAQGSTYRFYKVYLDCKYVVGDNTIIFNIPADLTQTDKFTITNRDSYAQDDENFPPYSAYDVSKTFTPGALLVQATNSVAVSDEGPVGVISNITNSVDSTNASEYLIYFEGQQTGILTDAVNILPDNSGAWAANGRYKVSNISQLQKGDMIQYSLDGNGEINGFRLLFSPANPGAFVEFGSPSITQIAILEPVYVNYGTVLAKSGDVFVINSLYGGASDTRAQSMNVSCSTIVSIYDSGSHTIKPAKGDSMQPGDKICIYNYFAQMFNVIIIR